MTGAAINTPAIAAFPMYDFPELRAAHDALWAALAEVLVERGLRGVPSRLTRDLGHQDVWRHPSLLFGQGCEYPFTKSFSNRLTIVATPRYSAPGCEDAFYRSAIIVRTHDHANTLEELRNRKCVISEVDSNSGMNLLRAAVAPLAGGVPFFESVQVSGSHRRSVTMVATGQADVAAVDCVTLAHLQNFDPALSARVRVLCWSPCSPSLPFVTARLTNESTIDALRAALTEVVTDSSLATVRERLLLEGVQLKPDTELSRVRQLERDAAERQYPVLR